MEFICKYCGKMCKNANSLAQHEIRCPNNPNRLDASKLGNHTSHIAWNKGLTKEQSKAVNKQSTSLKKHYQESGHPWTGRHHTAETLKKLSTCGCGGFRKHAGRGKKGKYKGYYCDSTYELAYIIYCLDHNINFKRNTTIYYTYEYKGKVYKYYPDFITDNGFVEIKGYHTEIVDLKTAAVKDTKITVLYGNDLLPMFDYVEKNYTYKTLADLYD